MQVMQDAAPIHEVTGGAAVPSVAISVVHDPFVLIAIQIIPVVIRIIGETQAEIIGHDVKELDVEMITLPGNRRRAIARRYDCRQ